MRRDFDRLTNGQSTAGGWEKGVAKNSLDPLTVTPANKAVAILFSYTPWVGKGWGGRKGGNALFCDVWKQFGFVKCKPEDILTISGSETTTRNSAKQYTASGCPSNVEWSVSGSGATISSTGLLTAGSTACGTLSITATCAACGTSDTQEVRVTDAGQWWFYSFDDCGSLGSCWAPAVACGAIVYIIEGAYKYTHSITWGSPYWGDSPCDQSAPNRTMNFLLCESGCVAWNEAWKIHKWVVITDKWDCP